MRGGEFTLGNDRLFFNVDLTRWGIASYQRQWESAIARLAQGATATALLTAYRGQGETPHLAWALWRENEWLYMQKQTFVPAEFTETFDPWNPDAQIGKRVPATEEGLPIAEWRTKLVHLFATAFGIRIPNYLI